MKCPLRHAALIICLALICGTAAGVGLLLIGRPDISAMLAPSSADPQRIMPDQQQRIIPAPQPQAAKKLPALPTHQKDARLAEHNKIRLEAGLHPLTWSDSIAYSAADRAHQMAMDCKLVANPRKKRMAAENLYIGDDGGSLPAKAVARWTEDRFGQTYANIVIPDARHAGCASAACKDGRRIAVCIYTRGLK